MTTKNLTIALDCMGGDNAPKSVIEGASSFVKKNQDVEFLLVGDELVLASLVANHKELRNASKIIHSNSVIDSNEKPSVALRKGKGSSMRMAIDLVKSGEADAIVSAGNTGALMAISKLVLRTLESVDRPALVTMMPTQNGGSVAFLDMGTNIECDSTNLCQFAVMGSAYYKAVTGIKNPSIAILNVGSEEMKGSDSVRNAATMLRESELSEDFKGFAEGDDILKGEINVIVTDGFSGNIALKSIEGAVKTVGVVMKHALKSSILSIIGLPLIYGALKKTKKRMDPRIYNGAMFVGLNGVVVKSHGGTDAFGFEMAIKTTCSLVKSKINEKIINDIINSDFTESLE